MARRQDGRIEPGQSLKSAISARAWNRAQDAADLVLGGRQQFTAPGYSSWPNSIVVRIQASTFPRIAETPLKPGHGIALPFGAFGQMLTNASPVPESGNTVPDEDHLPIFEPKTTPVVTITNQTFGVGSRCGVIASVSKLEGGFYTCRVVVGGIIRCRVLMLQQATSVVAPPPFPTNANLQPFWRRYLTSSDYGHASILGIGHSFRLNGTNSYPRVAECAVLLG